MAGLQHLQNSQGIIADEFVAGATLLVGDVVFFDPATNRVNKSLVVADYDSCVGVVVGGRSTFNEIVQDDMDIGIQAALVGQEVIVANHGIVKVLSDAAITSGDRVSPGTAATAGRVKTAVATNFVLGIALNLAGAAGVVVRVLLAGFTRTAMV